MRALQRLVVVSDNHGNAADPELEKKFFEWLHDFNPEIRIHGGDYLNLTALRKKASEVEQQEAIAPDIEAGKDFTRRLFAGGKINYLTRGNHDERIYELARDGTKAALKEFAESVCRDLDGHLRKLRVKQLPYDSRIGVLDAHGIRVIHGYAAGVSSARKFAQVYGTCVFGHTHSMDVAPAEKWPCPSVAYGAGCLMKIDQPYNSKAIGKLRHENGWIYGFTDGVSATYFQAKLKNGAVHAAAEIKVY